MTLSGFLSVEVLKLLCVVRPLLIADASPPISLLDITLLFVLTAEVTVPILLIPPVPPPLLGVPVVGLLLLLLSM